MVPDENKHERQSEHKHEHGLRLPPNTNANTNINERARTRAQTCTNTNTFPNTFRNEQRSAPNPFRHPNQTPNAEQRFPNAKRCSRQTLLQKTYISAEDNLSFTENLSIRNACACKLLTSGFLLQDRNMLALLR